MGMGDRTSDDTMGISVGVGLGTLDLATAWLMLLRVVGLVNVMDVSLSVGNEDWSMLSASSGFGKSERGEFGVEASGGRGVAHIASLLLVALLKGSPVADSTSSRTRSLYL